MTRQIGLAETAVVVGLLLLGTAVWLWHGTPALLAFAGMVAILVGLALAWQDGRKVAK